MGAMSASVSHRARALGHRARALGVLGGVVLAACAGAPSSSRPAAPARDAAASAAAPRFTDADEAEVRAVLAAQQAAWNAGDLDGFMAGYARTDQLVFTSGGNIRRGWQATHDKFLARYGGDPTTMGHLAFEIIQVQPVGRDGAVVLGRWRLTATPAAGSGIFSVIVERRAEGWRVIHDHTSVRTGGGNDETMRG